MTSMDREQIEAAVQRIGARYAFRSLSEENLDEWRAALAEAHGVPTGRIDATIVGHEITYRVLPEADEICIGPIVVRPRQD